MYAGARFRRAARETDKETLQKMRRSLALLIPIICLASFAPAFAETVDDPALKDAKVGDWIEHRLVMPPELGMETSTRQTIVAMTASEVTVEQATKMTMGGKPMPPQTQSMTRPRQIERSKADAAKNDPKAKSSEEKLKASDGKEYACTVYEVEEQGKKGRTWICKELPLSGLVRSEADGKVLMEMVGWGRGK